MQVNNQRILVWLPSPMGDAILCTPALRDIRNFYPKAEIYFFASKIVREILSPSKFCDQWLEQKFSNPFSAAAAFKKYNFTYAVLFKNNFASALSVFLAGIPKRIGYVRECRGMLLTEKLYPPRLANGKRKPTSMVDYYLAISSMMGGSTEQRHLELSFEPEKLQSVKNKLPDIESGRPLVILVPGGAFGPSKCWLPERFAQTADWLIENYNAKILISVSQAAMEREIADKICSSSKNKLVNLAQNPISLGELKALYSKATLVITNDTGPRHIAIALGSKLVTLFGPNNPAWTETNYKNEIEIVADAECVPCTEPVCKKDKHYCMLAITVDMVCNAAKKLLDKT